MDSHANSGHSRILTPIHLLDRYFIARDTLLGHAYRTVASGGSNGWLGMI